MYSRRAFLKSGGVGLFGISLGGLPTFLARAAGGDKASGLYQKRKVLVCIFQRGAMDGLMAVTPFTDSYLQAARPTLFMSAAKATKQPLIDLDGRFGLHPGMQAFQELFKEKRLAIVHGIGSPNTTRSHFDAQDYMESGTPFSKGTSSGWLNRATGLLGHEATPFRAVSVTSALPRSFYGDVPAMAISDLKNFALRSPGSPANLAAQSFEELYSQTASSLLKEIGTETLDAIKMLKQANLAAYRPENKAVYPNSPLGNSLKQIAQLIKINVGLEVAFAESNGWDTHYNQGTINGLFARNVADLSNSIAAFWNDIERYQDEVTVMTMTEFGRTVKQNGSGGTDHGRASCNFILGNRVSGGAVYGNLQPLAIENLADGRDLAVTTDFRNVFAEVATRHLKLHDNGTLFPGFKPETVGVMA